MAQTVLHYAFETTSPPRRFCAWAITLASAAEIGSRSVTSRVIVNGVVKIVASAFSSVNLFCVVLIFSLCKSYFTRSFNLLPSSVIGVAASTRPERVEFSGCIKLTSRDHCDAI